MEARFRKGRALEWAIVVCTFLITLLLLSNVSWADKPNDISAVSDLAAAYQQVEQTGWALQAAKQRGTEMDIGRARERNQIAESHMQQSLAHVAGVHAKDIGAMRAVGMGWGQISQELGMDPGLMGIGPKGALGRDQSVARDRDRDKDRDRDRDRERMEATMRQLTERGAPKHGMAALGSGSPGLGRGMAMGGSSHQSGRGFAGMSQSGGPHGAMGGSGMGGHGGGMGSSGIGGDGGGMGNGGGGGGK